MSISQGLKAGLAAGVIYGAMVGMLHLGTLEACSATQLTFIAHQLQNQNPPSSATASSLFATDVIYFPMIYGLWGLVYGVFYGLVFAALYLRLPGLTSKKKGMVLALPIFLIGAFLGPAAFNYACSPAFVPYIALAAGLPAAFVFGYVLGLFYDSFGRLVLEEKQSEATKRI